MADCAQGLRQAATSLSKGDSDLCSFILAGVEAQVDVLAPRHPYPRLPAACPHTFTSLTPDQTVEVKMQYVPSCQHMCTCALFCSPTPNCKACNGIVPVGDACST